MSAALAVFDEQDLPLSRELSDITFADCAVMDPWFED